MSPLRVFPAWQVCPGLVESANRAALVAVCESNDPNGSYRKPQGEPDYLTDADLRAVVLEWIADDYHVRQRG